MVDDLISRQAAIDILMKEWKAYKDYPYVSHVRHGLEIAIAILENKLPSAQRTGRWIGIEFGRCSCCGHEGCASDIWDGCKDGMFCPNCGAKMQEGEECMRGERDG